MKYGKLVTETLTLATTAYLHSNFVGDALEGVSFGAGVLFSYRAWNSDRFGMARGALASTAAFLYDVQGRFSLDSVDDLFTFGSHAINFGLASSIVVGTAYFLNNHHSFKNIEYPKGDDRGDDKGDWPPRGKPKGPGPTPRSPSGISREELYDKLRVTHLMTPSKKANSVDELVQ